VPNIVWAGSTGRRNTALAATAVAVGAWSHGTGRAGRRNTAILTTAGAAVAWGRYSDKKKEEQRRKQRRVVVYQRGPAVCREVVCVPKQEHGRKLGHWIGEGHHKHHGHGHDHHDHD